MFDFDLVQKRCGFVVSDLLYWATEFEKHLFGVDASMMYHNYTHDVRHGIVKDLLEQRFVTVIKAIGALIRPMMMLCNCLPEEAVQSPEAFFDCLNQIAATPTTIDHPNQRGMRLGA